MNYNPYSLEGKTILITGASSGIGCATAIECSKLGAICVITGRNTERLQETYNLLEGEGHYQIVADLATEEGIDALVGQCPEINGLVNNTGISNIKPIGFIKQDDLDFVFAANTFAPIMLTKTLLKKKKILNGASIVYTSSLAAINSGVANSVYGATKAAVASFARSCAIELSSRMIRSNAVLPGMVKTSMTENLVVSQEDQEKDMNNYLLKRYGRPEEVAWAIIYLLSDASAWVTGTNMILDGGRLLV